MKKSWSLYSRFKNFDTIFLRIQDDLISWKYDDLLPVSENNSHLFIDFS